MKKILFYLLPILLASSLMGCIKIEEVYKWKRNDGDTFYLRWKMENKKHLTLLTEYDNGKEKQSSVISYFRDCDYFDDRNWSCPSLTNLESIEMVNGNLIWHYWTEERHYEKQHKIVFD